MDAHDAPTSVDCELFAVTRGARVVEFGVKCSGKLLSNGASGGRTEQFEVIFLRQARSLLCCCVSGCYGRAGELSTSSQIGSDAFCEGGRQRRWCRWVGTTDRLSAYRARRLRSARQLTSARSSIPRAVGGRNAHRVAGGAAMKAIAIAGAGPPPTTRQARWRGSGCARKRRHRRAFRARPRVLRAGGVRGEPHPVNHVTMPLEDAARSRPWRTPTSAGSCGQSERSVPGRQAESHG